MDLPANKPQSLSLYARGVAVLEWLHFDLVDPVVDRFRRYEIRPSGMPISERELVVKKAYELQTGYRVLTVLTFAITLIPCVFVPANVETLVGLLGWFARLTASAAAIATFFVWVSAGGSADLRWVDLAFRHLYFCGALPSQKDRINAFTPTRTHLYPPLHLRLRNRHLRAVWIPLPADGSCDLQSACFARRRAVGMWELRKRRIEAQRVAAR